MNVSYLVAGWAILTAILALGWMGSAIRARAMARDHGAMEFGGAAGGIGAKKEAQGTLAQHQEFLEAIVNSVPCAVFVKDEENRFIIMNDAICAFLGCAREDLIGKTDFDIFPEDQARHFWEQDKQVQTGNPLYAEEAFCTADGTEHWVIKTKRVINLPGGRQCVAGAIADISAQKKAEQEAMRMSTFLNEMVNAMPNDIYVKDAEGRLALVNDAMCRAYGVERERLTGHVAGEFLPPEKAQIVAEQDRIVIEGNQPRTWELEAFTPGRVGQWLLVTKLPVRLPDGTRYLLGVNTDVTALKQAALEVERARQFFDLSINTLPYGMMVKDQAGRFVTANKAWCEIAGLALERIVGKTVWDIYPPDEAKALQDQDDLAFAAGEPVAFEQRASRLSGWQGWILKTKSVLALRDGSRFLVSGIVDITPQKQAALEIQQGKNFLEAMVNAIPQPIFVKNPDKRFVLVNRAASSEWGLEPREQIGLSDSDLMDPKRAQRVQDEDEQVLRSGQVMWFTDCRHLPDGGARWWLKSKCAVQLSDGSRVIVGLATDITSLKAVEQALLQSQSQLKVLNEVSGAMARHAGMAEVIGTAVAGLSRCLPGFRVSYAKVTSRRYLNISHSNGTADLPDLRGMRFDLHKWPKYKAAMETSGMQFCGDLREDKDYENKRGPYPDPGLNAILQVLLKVGDEWEGLLHLSSTHAHAWAENEIRFVSEVAEHLRIALREATAQRALNAQEARFRGLTAISSDWFWELDVHHRTTLVSEGVTKRTGRPAEHFLGKARWELPEVAPLNDPDYAKFKTTLNSHLPFHDNEFQ
ncbi:MAG: PAS domain S-box protein, partial [Burkholderiales bacterium]